MATTAHSHYTLPLPPNMDGERREGEFPVVTRSSPNEVRQRRFAPSQPVRQRRDINKYNHFFRGRDNVCQRGDACQQPTLSYYSCSMGGGTYFRSSRLNKKCATSTFGANLCWQTKQNISHFSQLFRSPLRAGGDNRGQRAYDSGLRPEEGLKRKTL